MAWIDYQKAFDSLSHSWLMEALHIYIANLQLIHLFKHLMLTCLTSFSVKGKTNSFKTREIHIKRVIFQDDALSPLWFCLSLKPLSNMLNRSSYFYNIDEQAQLTHLFYMDDVKLYARGQQQQQEGELELVGQNGRWRAC